MFNILLLIYGAVKYITISCIKVSSFAGKWLVYFLYHLQSIIYKLLVNIFGVFVIAFEDFNIFVIDLSNYLSTILVNLYTFLLILADRILHEFSDLKVGLFAIYSTVQSFVSGIYNVLVGIYAFGVQLCFYIKHYVLLFGSGVWFLFTLVPIGVVYFGTLSVYYVGRLCEEIYITAGNIKSNVGEVFLSVYNFVTDVPVESLLGLIAIVCLYYVVAPITKDSVMFVYRKLLYLLNKTSAKVSHCKRFLTVYYRNFCKPNAIPAPELNRRFNKVVNDNYCVACQDNEKCVLMLPCKHVCLCKDCYKRLPAQYGKSCPICRQRIAKSMDIFL